DEDLHASTEPRLERRGVAPPVQQSARLHGASTEPRLERRGVKACPAHANCPICFNGAAPRKARSDASKNSIRRPTPCFNGAAPRKARSEDLRISGLWTALASTEPRLERRGVGLIVQHL